MAYFQPAQETAQLRNDIMRRPPGFLHHNEGAIRYGHLLDHLCRSHHVNVTKAEGYRLSQRGPVLHPGGAPHAADLAALGSDRLGDRWYLS